MELSRRQLLGAGLCAGLVATTAKSTTLAEVVRNARPAAPCRRGRESSSIRRSTRSSSPAPAPRSTAIAPSLTHTDVVAITDFSRPSREARFFLLDTDTGQVTKHLVAHGRGSDPDHSGFLERFSNAIGSEASSAGGYVTGDYYPGQIRQVASRSPASIPRTATPRRARSSSTAPGMPSPSRPSCTASSAGRRAASPSPTPASRKCSTASAPAASSTPTRSPEGSFSVADAPRAGRNAGRRSGRPRLRPFRSFPARPPPSARTVLPSLVPFPRRTPLHRFAMKYIRYGVHNG